MCLDCLIWDLRAEGRGMGSRKESPGKSREPGSSQTTDECVWKRKCDSKGKEGTMGCSAAGCLSCRTLGISVHR